MLSQSLLEIILRFDLDLLRRALTLPRRGVSGSSVSLGLSLVVVLNDALVVLLHNVLGHTFHSEDLDLEALSVGKGILDTGKGFLVDLIHVDRKTCAGQPC